MNGTSLAPMPNKVQPALIGGVALGVASAIPILNCLNCACCAIAIGGGFLAAFLYLKDQPPTAEAPYGDGALLGLMAGVIGAVVATVVSIPFQLLQGAIGFKPDLSQLEEQLGDLPPEAADFLRSMVEGGGFSVMAILMAFFFYLVLFSIFAMIGAIIGVAVLHKQGGGTAPETSYGVSSSPSSPPPPPPSLVS